MRKASAPVVLDDEGEGGAGARALGGMDRFSCLRHIVIDMQHALWE